MAIPLTDQMLTEQEEVFARAFASADLEVARPLYHPQVVYISPTVRRFGWPVRIEGVYHTLRSIALTIQSCAAITYRAVEQAIDLHGPTLPACIALIAVFCP
jgi:hypothetical protein